MILAPTLTLSAGSGAAIVRPTFSRDFAGEKTLNNGTGPAITFTRASNATYFDADGVLQTAADDAPRFDHDPATGASRGLLIEESRTNSLRNSQGGGATVGTLTTSTSNTPTHWLASNFNSSNLVTEVVGTGTADGLAYIDIRFSRTVTPSSSSNAAVFFESTTQIVAAATETWTASAYIRLVAGSFTGLTGSNLIVAERTAAGAIIANKATTTSITGATGAALKTQRFSVTRTLDDATVERVVSSVNVVFPADVTFDLTLRIAAPQLELGAFPTSYIPTTTAAATRSVDSAVVTPVSSFYNQSGGTLFAEFSRYQTAGVADFLHFAGTSPNQVVLGTNAVAPSTSQRFLIETAASAQANIGFSGVSANTVYRMGGAYAANSFQAAQNATLGTEDTAGSLPTVTQMTIGAGKYGTDSLFKILNGHIRKIAYYPRRLSNTLLQQLTI